MAASRTIAIRLTLDEADKVRAALRGLGEDGKATLKALEDGSARAGVGQRGLSADADKATNSLGLARHQVQNLTAQVVDLGVQVSSGGGILMPLIQQGPQAVDAVGGVGAALRIVGSVLTPVTVGVAALAAGLLVAVTSAEKTDRAINDLSQRLRTTRSDFAELARDVEATARTLAGATSLTTADARAAGGAIAAARGFSGSRAEMERLVRTSEDVAKAFGVTVPEAAGRLASALDRPGQAARQLVEQGFRSMDDALRRQVELLEASGQKMEAARLVTEAYARGTAGAADTQTPFQRGLEDVSKAFTNLWNVVRPVLEAIGRPILNGIGEGFTFLAAKINSAAEAMARLALPDWLKSFLDRLDRLDQWASRTLGAPLPGSNYNADGTRRDAGPAPSPVTGPSDVAARILHGEAANQGETGLAAVAAVIANRARLTGQTPDQVVQAPGQFEPWGNAATRDRLMGMSPERYAEASRILQGVLSGQIPDPTGGATNFYAPRAQAALGRPAPAWDNGTGRDIGDHRFFAFPDQFTRGSGVPGAQGRTLAAADDQLRNWDNQEVRRQNNAASIRLFEEAAATPGISPERARDYADKLKELRAEAERLRDPMDMLRRQGEEQARVFEAAGGAARTLAEAELAGARAARAQGEGAAGQAARALEERAQAQERLNDALNSEIERRYRALQVTSTAASMAGQSRAQIVAATDAVEAQVKALEYAAFGTSAYEQAVRKLTEARRGERAVQADASTVDVIANQRDQLQLLETEIALVGRSTEARQAELAVMRERQRVANGGGDPDSAVSRIAQDNIRQMAALQSTRQQLENSWNEIARVGEQAFDRIGSAITEAFTNGSGKAVNFKNIAKAVFSEVVQAGLRLAVINPVLNSVFGGNRGTLGGALTVAGGGAGSQAGSYLSQANQSSGGMIGYAQQASGGAGLLRQAGSLSDLSGAYPFTPGYSFSSGMIGRVDRFVGTDMSGGIGGFLDTPIYSYGNLPGATNAALGNLGSGVYGPATPAAVAAEGAGSLSLGQAGAGALGIGAGLYGVYSGLQRGGAGGYTQAAAGGIGAASSAVGLAASSGLISASGTLAMLGPYGMIAAAVLAIVSQFLPSAKPSNKEGTATVSTTTGAVELGGGSKASRENTDQASGLAGEIKQMAEQVGKLAGLPGAVGGQLKVGFGDRDGAFIQTPWFIQHTGNNEEGYKALQTTAMKYIIGRAEEQATDAGVRQTIGRSAALNDGNSEAILGDLAWYQDTYKGLSKTKEEIEALKTTTTSFAQALAASRKAYDDAIAKATTLGLNVSTLAERMQEAQVAVGTARDTEYEGLVASLRRRYLRASGQGAVADDTERAMGYTAEMEQLTAKLTDMGVAAEVAQRALDALGGAQGTEQYQIAQARMSEMLSVSGSLQARLLRASGRDTDADTMERQMAYAQQVEELTAKLQALGVGTDETTRMMGLLTQAQSAEWAQVQKAKTEAGAGSAYTVVSSLRSYVSGLSTSDAAAGTILDRYAASRRQFDAVYGAAAAGDASSISGLQGYAETFRGIAREVYGGGQGYAEAVRLIGDRLGVITDLGSDALTQSFVAENARENTDRVVDAIAEQKAELAALRASLDLLLSRPAAA